VMEPLWNLRCVRRWSVCSHAQGIF